MANNTSVYFGYCQVVKLEPLYYRSYSELAMQYIEIDISYFSRVYPILNLEPDDIAQELRLQIWRKLDRYDPRLSTFKAWAKRVMRNRLYNLRRDTYFQGVNMLDAPNRAYFNVEDHGPD